jgi:hypothetical protein
MFFFEEMSILHAIHQLYGNEPFYEVLLESSWTFVVVTALVKEDERGGQGHTSTSLLHQSAM